ncbi:MAG: uridine diphosphate-N-acetylglucosamine-binding protein YvcK, partial [Candidatus Omnitrophica bacterium]|nr:uridine diphosphate-N-acetylglucosamine-binding protein YvcK [Candidatus Omnitrophota bacterium]
SSGRLRDQFDVLPPGDIRNCLVALADTEPLMSDLFQFRFSDESELKGHSFGNLFITALTKVTGDFDKAIKASSQVLAIRGKVIPATYKKVTLVAQHKDDSETVGEANIPKKRSPINRVYLKPDGCSPSQEALDAIRDADAIVFGPGSLYTSVIPNLLIKEIPDAIRKSKAIKIYVCNVMTQAGETDGYTAYDHVNAIISHTKPNLIDYCIINTTKIPEEFLLKYRQENAYPVVADTQKLKELGVEIIEGNVVSAVNYVRHNSDKLAKLIINLIHASMVYK